jgi:hypothetical protein
VKLSELISAFSQTQELLQKYATRTVNKAQVLRNWLFGFYIVEFEQQ